MKISIVIMLLSKLAEFITPEMVVKIINKTIDFIEDQIVKTSNEIDDAIFIPVIDKVRNALKLVDTSELESKINNETLTIVSSLFAELLTLIPNQKVNLVIDNIIDVIEYVIKESDTKVDDTFITPIINMIRSVCDIPDRD